MKRLYFFWVILLIGTFYIMFQMQAINDGLKNKTTPEFDIIKFEIPPTLEYSDSLFQSIKKVGVTNEVKSTLHWDNYYIPFYVGATILGWILLLKNFKIEKKWLFGLISILAIVAGICDYVENGALESLLENWETSNVEKAALFAKIKFGIILPLLGIVLLGWLFYLGKKIFSKFQ